MKPSEYCKRIGLASLEELSEISELSRHTLIRWWKEKPNRFKCVAHGSMAIKNQHKEAGIISVCNCLQEIKKSINEITKPKKGNMELLDRYFGIQQELYKHFGYKEDWVVIPLKSFTCYYWSLTGVGHGDEVKYAESIENVFDGTMEDGYSASIYTQCHLPKWVYPSEKYTMVCIDTHTDGNKFLAVFDNSKMVSEDSSPEWSEDSK
tara:strand:- start:482 stop:1102 length:621 start_codon:yes stop_codon:yes gene_type:complete